MELSLIIGAAFAVMLVSLIGVLFLWRKTGTWMNKNMRYLVTFSAGVFIIISYGLFSEALELANDVSVVVLGAIFGAALLELLTRLLPNPHHHHGAEGEHEHSSIDARRVLFGDAVHNTTDGILLVSTFLLSPHVGLVATGAIMLHEAVQEISEFFVLKQAGYSTVRALTLNFIVSSTIFIGVAIGLLAINISVLGPAIMAFAAGALLFVVFRDLLPSTMRAIIRNKNAGKHLLAGALGILVMFGVSLATPHAHGEGAEYNHESHTDIEPVNH